VVVIGEEGLGARVDRRHLAELLLRVRGRWSRSRPAAPESLVVTIQRRQPLARFGSSHRPAAASFFASRSCRACHWAARSRKDGLREIR
jgi:hypothetical protein